MGTTPRKPYFASLPQYSLDFGKAAVGQVTNWYTLLGSDWHVYQRAKRVFQLVYGLPSTASPFDVSLIGRAGDQGQLSQVHWNALGNFVHRMVTLVCAQLPSAHPITTNTDPRNQELAMLAEAVFADERRKAELVAMHRDTVAAAFITMLGWHVARFNPRGGGKADAGGLTMPGPPGPDGKPVLSAPVYYGGIDHRSYALWDVIWNPTSRSQRRNWIITKDYENRFELADQNPQFADKILTLPSDHEKVVDHWRRTGQHQFDEEEVPVYTLFHVERDGLVPKGMKGREATFLGDGTVLYDGSSPYGDMLPGVPLSPAKMVGTSVPHSPVGDMVPLQLGLNVLASSMLTNMANGAVANYAITNATDFDVEDAPDGGHIFEASGENAGVSQLPGVETPPEAYKQFDLALKFMQMLSGISDVSMGQHTAGMPASLAALLDAKTQEFANLFQANANTHVRKVYELILYINQSCIKVPRDIEVLVGDGRSYLKKGFVGSDLSSVPRVEVEESNPLWDSTAGKLQLLEMLSNPALVQNPELRRLVFTIIRTGKLDDYADPLEEQQRLMEYENEALRRGENPVVRQDDRHAAHIQSVLDNVVNTPEARADKRIASASNEHLWNHLVAMSGQALIEQPVLQLDPLGQPALDQLGQPMPQLGPDGQPAMQIVVGIPKPEAVAMLVATGQANDFQALIQLLPSPVPPAKPSDSGSALSGSGAPGTAPPKPDGGGGEPAPAGPAGGPPKLPPLPKSASTGERAPPPPKPIAA